MRTKLFKTINAYNVTLHVCNAHLRTLTNVLSVDYQDMNIYSMGYASRNVFKELMQTFQQTSARCVIQIAKHV